MFLVVCVVICCLQLSFNFATTQTTNDNIDNFGRSPLKDFISDFFIILSAATPCSLAFVFGRFAQNYKKILSIISKENISGAMLPSISERSETCHRRAGLPYGKKCSSYAGNVLELRLEMVLGRQRPLMLLSIFVFVCRNGRCKNTNKN